MWAGIIVTILLGGLAALFLTGRGAFLIAGFNTLSKDEKQRFDTPALCRFMGKIAVVLALCTLVWTLCGYGVFGRVVFYVALAVFLLTIAFALVWANTGNRFKKQ